MRYRSEIWLADLNPQIGSETGKVRPVLIVQTDLLNEEGHTSTIICPITTNVKDAEYIRIFIKGGTCGVNEDCDIMIDQMRSIDNSRFIKRLGQIPAKKQKLVNEYIKVLLDLDL